MSGIRAQAKRRLMRDRHYIHLVGGLGRVKRDSIIELAVRFSNGRSLPIGWIKANRQDPKVNWGRRP